MTRSSTVHRGSTRLCIFYARAWGTIALSGVFCISDNMEEGGGYLYYDAFSHHIRKCGLFAWGIYSHLLDHCRTLISSVYPKSSTARTALRCRQIVPCPCLAGEDPMQDHPCKEMGIQVIFAQLFPFPLFASPNSTKYLVAFRPSAQTHHPTPNAIAPALPCGPACRRKC